MSSNFQSTIDCAVIDESNIGHFMGHEGGFVGRDWDEYPLGTIAADGVPCAPVIPIRQMERKEIIERATELEQNKARLSDKIIRKGMKAKMQSQTNFCASNATIGAFQAARIAEGYENTDLSAASVACILTNYQNIGHWPGKAVQLLASHGLHGGAVPEGNGPGQWPANDINPKWDTPASQAARRDNRCQEWWDIPKFSFTYLATCLVLGHPAATVFMRIRHVLLSLDVVVDRNRLGIRYLNSYSPNWGTNGYAIMWEDLARPDEAIVPRVVSGG